MPLRPHLPPYRDYQLAKRFAWDPQQIDLAQDVKDWAALAPAERDVMCNLCSLFIAGEEAVASDLAPMLYALGRVGGLREEEMFLTTQLFDESLHVEFFSRWFAQVVGPTDHSRYWGSAYRTLFFEALPQALNALLTDHSPQAFARALVHYHIIVEGTLAETGYYAAFTACQRKGVLPGLVQGFERIKRDESRHIAYGLYALQRLLRAHPELWEEVTATLTELLNLTLTVIPETLEPYGDAIPFGITLDEITEYALEQYTHRYHVLERAHQGE
jgi:ribonucleoside-diphosphate reductase beta chain